MRKIILTLIGLSATISMVGQQMIKVENPGDFNEIKLSGKLNVELIKSKTQNPSIDIELFNSDSKNLNWNVGKQGLTISLRPIKDSYANVKIYYTDIKSINVSGSSVLCKDTIQCLMFDGVVSNGAKVSMLISCEDAEISVTGNSAFSAAGKTKYLTLLANENSKVDTREFVAQSVRADSATKGEIYLLSLERLSAQAGTGSVIFYKGDPLILRAKTSTIGLGASINSIGK